MRYTRTGVIAILIAVEIFIAGAIVASASGLNPFVNMHDARTFDYTPSAIATVDAGDTPHVVIDDHDSRVTVVASTDGKIHVTDGTHIHGWGWGPRPAQLKVEKTSDGVLIQRAAVAERIVILGFEAGGTTVEVPAGSTVEIRDSSGASLSGLTGAIDVRSNDGRISATDVRTANMSLMTSDGRITLTNVDAGTLNAQTSDGSIHGYGLHVGTGTLHTADGSITVALSNAGDVKVRAQTSDGSIRFNGLRQSDSPAEYTFGNGSGSLDVATQDGSIRITSNGAQEQ